MPCIYLKERFAAEITAIWVNKTTVFMFEWIFMYRDKNSIIHHFRSAVSSQFRKEWRQCVPKNWVSDSKSAWGWGRRWEVWKKKKWFHEMWEWKDFFPPLSISGNMPFWILHVVKFHALNIVSVCGGNACTGRSDPRMDSNWLSGKHRGQLVCFVVKGRGFCLSSELGNEPAEQPWLLMLGPVISSCLIILNSSSSPDSYIQMPDHISTWASDERHISTSTCLEANASSVLPHCTSHHFSEQQGLRLGAVQSLIPLPHESLHTQSISKACWLHLQNWYIT